MWKSKLLAVLCTGFLILFIYGCGKEGKGKKNPVVAGEHTHKSETKSHAHGGETGSHSHETEAKSHTHGGETGSHSHGGTHADHSHDSEGSGHQIGLDGTLNEVQKGIRLMLSFDSDSSTFVGSMENVSQHTIANVCVDVHLSDGTLLDPAEPVDLAPGKKIEIKLPAMDHTFTGWNARVVTDPAKH